MNFVFLTLLYQFLVILLHLILVTILGEKCELCDFFPHFHADIIFFLFGTSSSVSLNVLPTQNDVKLYIYPYICT